MSLEFLPWTPPPMGGAVDAAGGVRWMRLPVPGSLAHINIWHAPGRQGRVLIDTGMNQPETRAAWDALSAGEGLDAALSAILVLTVALENELTAGVYVTTLFQGACALILFALLTMRRIRPGAAPAAFAPREFNPGFLIPSPR